MAGVFTHNGNIVEGLPSTANMINYDNTSSGMQATQLQAAVDELNTNKQSKTDNNLTTTNKTITGGINELKSGLTTLDNEVNGDSTVYPYADVITIEDAIPANLADCSVKIEPVQDLHGYDKPWVGGAGKNLCPVAKMNTLNSDTFKLNAGTYALSFKMAGSGLYSTSSVILRDDSNADVLSVSVGSASSGTVKNGQFTLQSETTLHLYVNNISTDASGYYIEDIQCELGSTATDYAPYTNICPITGHTEASVQRDGKNLLSVNSYSGSGTWFSSKTIPVLGRYLYRRANFTTSGGGAYTFKVVGIKNGVETDIDTSAYTGDMHTYNDVSAYDFVKVSGYSNNSNNAITNAMLCFNDNNTDTIAYVPYAGNTYTIALGDTIYGGTVDFDSGVMTVTHELAEHDGDENWQGGTALINTYRMVLDIDAISSANEISNYLPRVNNYALDEPHFYIYNSKLYVFLPVSDETEFKSYLASNPLQVCYKLATPTTIQLTPQQIQLLKGQNTLTASTGQISVTVNGVSGAIGQVQEQVNELAEDVALKQNATDNNLQTTDKTIVGGINEVKSGLIDANSNIATINGKLSLSGNASSVIADNFVNDSGFAITINGSSGVGWKIYFSTDNNRIAVEEWSNGSQVLYKSVTLT